MQGRREANRAGCLPRGARRAVLAVLLLTLAAGAAPPPAPEMSGHGGPVRAVVTLDGDAAIATGGFDSRIIVWSLEPALARQVLQHHDSTVNALASIGGGCLVSAGEDGRIALWCGGESKPRRVVAAHTAPVAALAVSPDRRTLASAGWDHAVRLWPIADLLDAAKAPVPRVVDGHAGPVNGVAFAADGQRIVTAGYDGQVRATSLSVETSSDAFSVDAPINAVAVSPAGTVVTAGADGRVRFFGARLEPIGSLDLGHGPLTTVALSPDGARLATAGMRTPVTLIDTRERRVTGEILGPGLPVWSVVFAREGRELITGGADRAVRRWNPDTGKPAGGDIAAAASDATAEDPHPGARVFRACKACHGLTADDVGRAGPTLYGIFGRRIASAPGYVYSDALKTLDVTWSAATISRLFEVGPNAYLPGTKMPEQRITNQEDREALVDWLAAKTAP